MRRHEKWSVEPTIGLAFVIVSVIIGGMVLAVISLTAAATMNPTPEQTIIQKVETTGDVKRLCVEARTGRAHRSHELRAYRPAIRRRHAMSDGKRRASERKPSWLRAFVPKSSPLWSLSARGAACTSSRIAKPCGMCGITDVWRVTT